MTLLLDTHVWLWILADPDALGDLRPIIDDSATELLLSAASSWGISIKHAIGRLSLPEPPTAFVPSRIRATGVTPLSARTHGSGVGTSSDAAAQP